MKYYAFLLRFLSIQLLLHVFAIPSLKATNFYSKGDLPANVRTNWSSTTTGAGASPSTTQWGQGGHFFIIQNGDAMTTTAAWNLPSNLQIDAGGSLTTSTTNTHTLSIVGTTMVSGTLLLRNNAVKTFTGNTTVNSGGIVTISGNGTTTFTNNLSVSVGGTLNHNNNYDNASVYLQVNGDMAINGVYNYAGFSPAIWMNGTGTKYISTGTTSLCKLLLRQGNFYANGAVTINEDFYAMWNQVGGSFHTNGKTITANWGVVNNGGTFYVDGGTLTVGSSIGGMLIGRTLTQNGDLQVSSGTLNSPGIYLGTTAASPKGSCTQSGGTINTNVVDIGHSSSFVQSGGVNNVNGSVNLNYSSSTYSHTTGATTLNILGDLNNNGVYSTGAGAAAINISGNWINNLTFTTSSTNTVTFNGGSNQLITGTASTGFNNLVIDPVAGISVTLARNSSMGGNLSVLKGIFDIGTFTCNRTAAGGTFSLSTATLFKLAGGSGGAGSSNFPNNFTTHTFHTNSTVEYNGSVNQAIFSTPGYGYLTLSTGGTKTAGGALSIASDLNINTTALFAGSTFIHNLKGSWYNNVSAAAFVPGSSTIHFNGTVAQAIGGVYGSTFNNLTVNNAAGVNMAFDQTVNSTLTLTAGNLNIGIKNLTLAAAAAAVAGSPFSAAKMIIADGGGEVRKLYAGAGSYLFPIGDNSGTAEYSPVTLNFTSGTFAAGAYASVKVTNVKHGNNASSTNFLKRFWTIGNSGVSSHSFTITATYTAADIAGTESGIAAAKFSGSLPWVKYGVIGSNTLTTTGSTNNGTGIIFTGISNLVPTASISGGGISICPAANVSLGSGVSNNGTPLITYAWSPAAGLSSTIIANPVATPAATTIYTLIVTDGNGITSSPVHTTITISSPAAPTASATTQPTCLLPTGVITLTAPSGTGMTYSNDGVIYTNTTGVFNAMIPGTYQLRAKNNIGCISAPSQVIINAIPAAPAAPTATVTVQPTCLAATGTILVTAPTGVGMSYSINGINYTNVTGLFTGVNAGSYNVTARNSSGCTSGISSVTVNTQPVRPTGVLNGSGTLCRGNATNLSLAVTGAGTISGTLSDGTAFSGTAPMITIPVNPLVTTSYSINTLGNSTCTSIAGDKTGTAVITVSAAPAATILYAGSPFCWNAGSATVSISGTTGGSFSSSPAGASLNVINGDIDLDASAPGMYTITYAVPAAGGCSLYTTSTVVRINPNIWTGQFSSDWNTAGNWVSNMVPTQQCADVTILSNAIYQPVINSGTISVENIFIKPGAFLVISNATIQVSGTINNSGTFTISNGTLELNGAVPQVIPANAFQANALKNLVINNTSAAGVELNGELDIYSSLTYIGAGKKMNTNDFLTLKSTAANTAHIGVMTGNTLTGQVTVERYISAKRAWHLLSVPTKTLQTIKTAWQEGASNSGSIPANGFGLQITTNTAEWASNGFDFYSPNGPSMKKFNSMSNKWECIGSTNINFPTQASGYMTFVRGDRTANGLNAAAVQTVLRTKGALNYGDQLPITVSASKFACVANPYASAVDMRTIEKTGVKDFFYVWDPKLSGVNGLGAYQTFSWNGSNYVVTPGMGSYGTNGSINNTIQSGQAFLVEGMATGGNLVFKESAKASGSLLASRPVDQPGPGLRVNLNGLNTDSSKYLADGVMIDFDDKYSNNIDEWDAYKLGNTNENLAIKTCNRSLIIERRKPVVKNDTIFLHINGLRAQNYQFDIQGSGLAEQGLVCYLEDIYSKTSTLLDLSLTTSFNFNVSKLPASFAPDRFRIVFTKPLILPVTFNGIKAEKIKGTIGVEWKVEHEANVKQYIVERSSDGAGFKVVHTTPAKNGAATIYNWNDSNGTPGNNFYKVQSLDIDGNTRYSKIVKVFLNQSPGSIRVYPNPIQAGIINLQLENEPVGIYKARLLNVSGQVMMNKVINRLNPSGMETIHLKKSIPHGIYQLEITKPGGEVSNLKLIY